MTPIRGRPFPCRCCRSRSFLRSWRISASRATPGPRAGLRAFSFADAGMGRKGGVLDGTKIRSWQPPKEVSGPWGKKLFRSSPTSNKSLGMVLNLLRWVWMLNYPSLIRPSCTFRILDVFVGFGLIPHISPCRYHSRNFNSGWCSTGHWQIGRAEGCKMVRWTLIGESLLTPEK